MRQSLEYITDIVVVFSVYSYNVHIIIILLGRNHYCCFAISCNNTDGFSFLNSFCQFIKTFWVSSTVNTSMDSIKIVGVIPTPPARFELATTRLTVMLYQRIMFAIRNNEWRIGDSNSNFHRAKVALYQLVNSWASNNRLELLTFALQKHCSIQLNIIWAFFSSLLSLK